MGGQFRKVVGNGRLIVLPDDLAILIQYTAILDDWYRLNFGKMCSGCRQTREGVSHNPIDSRMETHQSLSHNRDPCAPETFAPTAINSNIGVRREQTLEGPLETGITD